MDRKINIPMALACVLLCLTLITTHLTGGLFARYTTTAQASDGARVAKFDVRGSIDDQDVKVDCQATEKFGTYTITVDNQSEVAINYVIWITLDQEVVGTDLLVKMEGKEVEEVTQKMKFTRGPLEPGKSNTHEVAFGIDTWTTVTGKVNGPETCNWDLGFTVDIIATQID